jgi:hypothetical protein
MHKKAKIMPHRYKENPKKDVFLDVGEIYLEKKRKTIPKAFGRKTIIGKSFMPVP